MYYNQTDIHHCYYAIADVDAENTYCHRNLVEYLLNTNLLRIFTVWVSLEKCMVNHLHLLRKIELKLELPAHCVIKGRGQLQII